MNVVSECDKVLLVQAELDGELDAAEAAALAAHRAQCPICQAAAAELARARALIGDGLYQVMPDDARARVMARIAATRAPGALTEFGARRVRRALPVAPVVVVCGKLRARRRLRRGACAAGAAAPPAPSRR